jgi:hypothetical protein
VGEKSRNVAGAVGDAIRGLQRAVGTARTYPEANATTERALAALQERLRNVLPLKLSLEPENLVVEETSLLSDDNALQSLVSALYLDGIRVIELCADLARPELDRFVNALAAPYEADDLSGDYVTRLWEAELPNVTVVALDPYLDAELPEDVLEGKERPSGEAEGIPLTLTPIVDAAPAEAFSISEDDAEAMQIARARSEAAPPWEGFVAALVNTSASPTGRRRPNEIVLVVETTIQRLVAQGRFALARSLWVGVEGAAVSEVRQFLPDARLRITQLERWDTVFAAAEAGAIEAEAAIALILALDQSAVPVAMSGLAGSESPSARNFWVDCVSALGLATVPPLLDMLRAAPGLALDIVEILGRLGDPRAAAPLAQILATGAPDLRRKILLLLASDPASNAHLVAAATSDPDERCRITALGGLARTEHAPDAVELVAAARARDFNERSEAEQDAMYRALAAIGGRAALDFFAEQLRPTRLSRKVRPDQRRAASALSRAGTPDARMVLEAASFAGGAVAEVCARALRGAAR